MGSIPFAISIHKFVSSTGADAGFAALVGLAILILLYFAQARETATLREQAAEAGERAEQLEQRVAELARELAAGAPEPAPATVKPAATAAVTRATARPRIHLGPPAGVAAPALAAATRLIPLPTDNGVAEAVEWPGEPIKVHRAATEAPAPPSTVARGNGHSRVPAGGRTPDAPAARTVGGRVGARRHAGAPRRPLIPPEPPRRRSPVAKVLFAAAWPPGRRRRRRRGADRDLARAQPVPRRPPCVPTETPGTRQTVSLQPEDGDRGRAQRNRHHRARSPYGGAPDERWLPAGGGRHRHRPDTDDHPVAFLPGYRSDASRVASTLKLPSGSVQPIDPGTRAVACPPPAACTTNVVVTVGSDLAIYGLSFIELPKRSAKPREQGVTHVLDKGLSVAEVDGLIEVAGDFVDIVKLGWGTALATANLKPKLARYAEHGIPVVLGGTLTELALAQDRLDQLIEWVQRARPEALRDLRRHDRARPRPQARADRAAGARASRSCPRSAPRTTRARSRRPTAGWR